MMRSLSKLATALGVASVLVALIGVAVLVAQPAVADQTYNNQGVANLTLGM
jgi:hypothetical protein